jgi:hypothetical protein
MKKTIFLTALSLLISLPNIALAEVSIFDKPLKIKTISLGVSPDRSDSYEMMVTCQYFKDFMIKEVNLGEKGAAQLSILPVTSKNQFPTCQRKNVPQEYIINDWAGYFKGVKARYVFFDAADGINRGVGFAVFDGHNSKKIFDDVIKGNFKTIEVDGSQLSLRYKRVYQAPCSMITEGQACWDKIRKETGLRKSLRPDCAADSVVMAYDVQVSVRPSKTTINPIEDNKLDCWPAS